MSKIDWRNFSDLTSSCREKTLASKSRNAFFNFDHQNKTITDLGLDKLKPSLEFFLMDGETFDLASIRQGGNKSRSGNIDKNYSAKNDLDDQSLTRVVLNWQNLIIRQLVEKLDEFGVVLAYLTSKNASSNNSDGSVNTLTAKIDDLQLQNNDLQQKSLKGNIIISSPHSNERPSLLKAETITDPATKEQRKESPLEMCSRLIRQKTGVIVPKNDVSACHALSARGTSFLVKFSNRNQGSAWDTIATGMLTGKNNVSKQNFDRNSNIFINFQLNKYNNDLLKSVKLAKTNNKIRKYGIDQNARISVKIKQADPNQERFVIIKSKNHLQELIAPTSSAN